MSEAFFRGAVLTVLIGIGAFSMKISVNTDLSRMYLSAISRDFTTLVNVVAEKLK